MAAAVHRVKERERAVSGTDIGIGNGNGNGIGSSATDADPGTEPVNGSRESPDLLRLGIYCPATDEESP